LRPGGRVNPPVRLAGVGADAVEYVRERGRGIPGTSMSKPLSRRSRDSFAEMPHVEIEDPSVSRKDATIANVRTTELCLLGALGVLARGSVLVAAEGRSASPRRPLRLSPSSQFPDPSLSASAVPTAYSLPPPACSRNFRINVDIYETYIRRSASIYDRSAAGRGGGCHWNHRSRHMLSREQETWPPVLFVFLVTIMRGHTLAIRCKTNPRGHRRWCKQSQFQGVRPEPEGERRETNPIPATMPIRRSAFPGGRSLRNKPNWARLGQGRARRARDAKQSQFGGKWLKEKGLW
jgi:hypothetical protein